MSVTSFDRRPPQPVEQGRAEPVVLDALPLAQEARVEDLPPGAEVDVERLEPAVEKAVGRLTCDLGRQVLAACPGRRPQRRAIFGAQTGDVLLHPRDELVAVVDLAERVLQLL